MLLRLLPTISPSQPSPPTILFTLPMQTHPYTSRSLPLPPNLHAHRSVCLQEDVECANVLLGEKSSWISGVIDDVTFSLPRDQVSVTLINGSTITLPLPSECSTRLQCVIHEVQLSFAPGPEHFTRETACSTSPASTSLSSSGSCRPSWTITPPTRRSPSALLLSLLSPLLPVNQSLASAAPSRIVQQPPARLHRRQARSLLVDAYRRHVLPLVKEQLPEAYLPWAIASESSKRLEDFETLRGEIDATLVTAGVDKTTDAYSTPLKRCRSSSSCSSSDSDSDSDATPSPVTPATTSFSPSACSTPPRARSSPNPQSFLLAIPPAHVLPAAYRAAYSAQLAQLTRIASRVSAINKLNAMYEREMGKRRWLESLECGRAGDKAHRRALSNGHTLREACGVTCEPVKGSRLWRSWTPEDEEHAQHEADHPTHPAMMDLYAIEEVSSSCPDSESEISSDEGLASPRPMIHLSSSIEDVVNDKVIIVRPPPMHRDAEDAESEDDTPSLMTSRSDDSLTETEGWEAQIPTQEKEHPMLPPPVITMKWKSATLPPRQKPKSVEVGWADESYQSLEVVYA